jgi:hypothetical protein
MKILILTIFIIYVSTLNIEEFINESFRDSLKCGASSIDGLFKINYSATPPIGVPLAGYSNRKVIYLKIKHKG